jgi:hypothetical protein
VARNTRQSATSHWFVTWIDDDEQRVALARESMTVSPRPESIAAVSARPELRSYWELCLRSWQSPMAMEFRFRHGLRYRQLLDRHLRQLIAGVVTPEQSMADCSLAWEALTEELGRPRQLRSLERSLQLAN